MSSVQRLYTDHIRGTAAHELVSDVTIVLCTLTGVVMVVCVLDSNRVYLTAKALKHLYDKRPAEEFEFLITWLWKTIRFPEQIYANKGEKRGNYLFVRHIKNDHYLCALEVVVDDLNGSKSLYVTTAFRLKKPSYLLSYKLLWSWKGGGPSS